MTYLVGWKGRHRRPLTKVYANPRMGLPSAGELLRPMRRRLHRLSGASACLVVLALLLVAFLAWAIPAYADDGQPVSIRDVGFEPRLDGQVPLDLVFRDEAGQPVPLRDYFDGRPIILSLNYYNCPNLCPLVLDGLAGTLAKLPFTLGNEYRIITVSIDPRETSQEAATTKARLLQRYGRPEASELAAGWRLLTGDEGAIQELARSVGFRYAYDAQQQIYAHPVGLILLTPGGRIARYLYGMDFPPRDLRLALVEASQNKISSPIDQILLLCYQYNPQTGRYSAVALNAVRAGGVLTVLTLGGFLARQWRRELRRNGPAAGA